MKGFEVKHFRKYIIGLQVALTSRELRKIEFEIVIFCSNIIL